MAKQQSFLVVLPKNEQSIIDNNGIINPQYLPLSSSICRKALKDFVGTTGLSGVDNWLTIVEDYIAINYASVTEDVNIYYNDFWAESGLLWTTAKTALQTFFSWDNDTANQRINSVISHAKVLRGTIALNTSVTTIQITSSAQALLALSSFYDTAGSPTGAVSWLSIIEDDMTNNHNLSSDPYQIRYRSDWPINGIMWNYVATTLQNYFSWTTEITYLRMDTIQTYAKTIQ